MKKRIISLLLVIAFMISVVPGFGIAVSAGNSKGPGESATVLTVDSTWGNPGKTVDLDLILTENPGILGATITISWDENLTLVADTSGEAFNHMTYTSPSRYVASGTNFVWFGNEVDEAIDGTILTLTFQVSENAQNNDILPVRVTYTLGDIIDENDNDVILNITDGSVRVITYQPGDVTSDGRVNARDLVRLSQYISDGCKTDPEGYNAEVVGEACDVNGDGRVNARDLIKLSQYISDGSQTNPDGYNAVLKPAKMPECEHANMQATAAKEASCTEVGNISYWYCSGCGKYFSDAAGTTEITFADTVLTNGSHTLTSVVAKSATCTDVGNIAYWSCSACGKYFSDANATGEILLADTVVSAQGHDLTKITENAASCTEAGNITYWYCEVCQKSYSDEDAEIEIDADSTVITAKGHAVQAVIAKSATCTEPGNIAYWYCSACEKYFSDGNGTFEILLAETIVQAKGHTYSDSWSNDETYHWHASACGHSEEFSDKSTHTFEGNVCTICSFDKSIKLNTPSISKIEYDTVYWEPVDNADLYLIRINGDYEYRTRNTYCEISMVRNAMGNGITLLANKEPITINVQVMAIGYDNYSNSNWSSIDNRYVYIPVSNDAAKVEELANYRLGYGYNLIEDEYLRIANASRYSVLDVGKLLTLGQYTRTDNTKGYSDYYSYSSVDEFMSKRENNFDASVGVKIPLAGSLKAQLSSSMSEHYSNYSYNEMFVADVGVTIADHQLLNLKDEYLKYCMSVDFLKVIYRQTPETENLTDEELVEYIYERYGTHIILGVTTGGSYLAQYTVSTNSENIASSVKSSFNLTGAVNIQKILEVDIGISVSGSEETEWKTSTTEAHFQVLWAGGTSGATTNPANLDSAIQSWTQSVSGNPVSVRFTEGGAVSMGSLIRTVDSALADAFEEYVDSKADETYESLYAQYDKNLSRLISAPYTENGQNVIAVDLSSFQRSGSMESAYDPNFLDNILTIYPIMYGVKIDKIIVNGAFNDAVAQSQLIDNFSIALSKEWNRDVEIVINNLGAVCASEQGIVDLSAVAKNIQVDISYTGVNMTEETDGECRFVGAINDMPYEFYFDVQDDVLLDYGTIQIDGTKLFLPVAEKASYTFMGWYTSDEVQVTDSLGEMIDGFEFTDEKIVLYAKWDPMTFKILLDDQRATVVGTENIFEKYNQGFYSDFEGTVELTNIVIPEKTGYVFGGYYGSVENNGTASAIGVDQYILVDGTIVALNAAFFDNTTIYALWIPNVYTVLLEGQGATMLGTSAYYEKYSVGIYAEQPCVSLMDKIDVPQRDGYVFAGYFEGINGTGVKRIAADGSILSDEFTYTDNVTLYAYWVNGVYTVILDSNGANLSGTTTFYENYNVAFCEDIDCSKVITAIAIPEKTGYTFDGYYLGSVQYIDESGTILVPSASFASNVTLVAQWTPITYTVNYNANTPSAASSNVTGMPSSAIWTYDENATLGTAPFLTGWTFQGWGTNKSVSSKLGDAEQTLTAPNLTSAVDGSVTLYALWVANQCKVTFDPNGGTVSHPTKTVRYDFTYGNDSFLPTPERAGYAFVGWYTEKTGGTLITNDTVVATTAKTQTLYAHWTPTIRIWEATAANGKRGVTEKDMQGDYFLIAIQVQKGCPGYSIVTHQDDRIDSITFVDLDITTLKDTLKYTHVTITIKFNMCEWTDGYEEFWVYSSSGKELWHKEFEHGSGYLKESIGSYEFSYDVDISLLSSDGSLSIKYGAHGEDSDIWLLGDTTITIEAIKK